MAQKVAPPPTPARSYSLSASGHLQWVASFHPLPLTHPLPNGHSRDLGLNHHPYEFVIGHHHPYPPFIWTAGINGKGKERKEINERKILKWKGKWDFKKARNGTPVSVHVYRQPQDDDHANYFKGRKSKVNGANGNGIASAVPRWIRL